MSAVATTDIHHQSRLAAPTGVSRLSMDRRRFEVSGLAEPLPTEPRELFNAREAARRFPDSASHLARLALIELAHGDTQMAAEIARRASSIATHENDSPAAILAAEVLFDTGDLSGAREALQTEGSNPAAAYLRAQVQLADSDIEGALASLPASDDFITLQMRGWAFLRMARYSEAIHFFRRALRLSPRMPDLLSNLGYAYGCIGAYSKAIAFTSQAVQLAPGKRHAHLNIVGFCVLMGDYDAALGRLEEMKRRFPTDPTVDVAVADVLMRQGSPNKALRILQELRARPATARLDRKSKAELLADVAFLEWRLDRLGRPDAIERIRRELLRCDYESLDVARLLMSLVLRPPNPDLSQAETLVAGLQEKYPADALHGFVSSLAFEQGDFSQALESAEKWLTLEPFSEAAACIVTYLLSDFHERYEDAAKVGTIALRRIPGSAMLANNVAFTLAMSGYPADAKRVIDTFPVDDRPAVMLATEGAISLVEGDIEAAERAYRRAMDIAHKDGLDDLAEMISFRYAILRVQLGIDELVSLPPTHSDDARWQLLRSLANRYGIKF